MVLGTTISKGHSDGFKCPHERFKCLDTRQLGGSHYGFSHHIGHTLLQIDIYCPEKKMELK